MRAIEANESAIDRLRLSNEKAIGELRSDIEKSINAHTTKMMIFIGVAIGIITLIIKFL